MANRVNLILKVKLKRANIGSIICENKDIIDSWE